MLGIEFHERVDILGVTFGTTIALSMKDICSNVTRAARAEARRAHPRNLCLAQRIHYVRLWLLTKICHVAQIFPLTRMHTQQLSTICSWFIWKGATFRVPISTLQRPKLDGG
jgi:hypothetical protein